MNAYLFTGLGAKKGNRYSVGLESLARKIEASGHKAIVLQWREWESVADAIQGKDANRYAFIGHSQGCQSITDLANFLKSKGVTVPYLVGIDPTAGYIPKYWPFPLSPFALNPVPNNVRNVDEFWATTGVAQSARKSTRNNRGALSYARDFRGNKNNSPHIIPGNHVAIAGSPDVHSIIIGRITEIEKGMNP